MATVSSQQQQQQRQFPDPSAWHRPLRIGFLHPDLGIGGAERLVVDAAVGLQHLGHHVEIFTSHHDPSHCFEETRDGTLKVHVLGATLPRSIASAFLLPMAILRQLHLIFLLLLSLVLYRLPLPASLKRALSPHGLSPEGTPPFDVFFIDQLSAGVPFLRWFSQTRAVFYCHFPDKEVGLEIATRRAAEQGRKGGGTSWLRRIYRLPWDWLEETTTNNADKILVNSDYTASVFRTSFRRLQRTPRTLYPGIDLAAYDEESVRAVLERTESKELAVVQSSRLTLLSINRFEGKKNVALAIQAFSRVVGETVASSTLAKGRLRLVVAGGHDPRVKDNVDTLASLQALAQSLSLSHATIQARSGGTLSSHGTSSPSSAASEADVLFLLNLTTAQRTALLTSPDTLVLLYTPPNEHFGIVPLEAMACGLPVLAVDHGGPKETIVDASAELGLPPIPSSSPAPGSEAEKVAPSASTSGKLGTGVLRPTDPEAWSSALLALISLQPAQRSALSSAARARVRERFTLDAMSSSLSHILREVASAGAVGLEDGLLLWITSWALVILPSAFIFVILRFDGGGLAAMERETAAATIGA